MALGRLLALLPALVLTLPDHVAGQEEAAVRDAVLRHYAAINAGDLNTVIQHHAEHFSGFLSDNGLLTDMHSRRQQQESWGPAAAAGWKWTVDIRHIQVTVRGNTGIATFDGTGTLVFPGQAPVARTWRITEVWVKEGGQWLELHHHDSPLAATP